MEVRLRGSAPDGAEKRPSKKVPARRFFTARRFNDA